MRSRWLALVLLCSCTPDTAIPPEATVSCGDDADCPAPFRFCHPVEHVCRLKVEEVVLPEPAVAFHVPRPDAVRVPLRPELLLAFSMDVDPASLAGRVSLTAEGDARALEPKPTSLANTFELPLAADLLPETVYTLEVAPGVAPLASAAKPSTTPYSARFTTDQAPDLQAPAPVQDLVVDHPAEKTFTLSWTPPTDPDFAGVLILRRQGAAVADVPVQGVSYGSGTRIGTSVVVGATHDASWVDVVPVEAAWDYAFFSFDRLDNYSAPRRAPFVTGTLLESCAGAGRVSASATDAGGFQVRLRPPGAQTEVVWPSSPAPFESVVQLAGAGLTPGTRYSATVVATGPSGKRLEKPADYWALPADLGALTAPLAVLPGGTAQLTFPVFGWTAFEAEVDTDPAAGKETWTATGVTATAGKATAAVALAGKYRFRVRPVDFPGCPAPAFTQSPEFAVGNALYVSPAGDDAKLGGDPASAVKTLARADQRVAALGAGTDVFVAAGDYLDLLTVRAGARYFGGWDAAFTAREDPRVSGSRKSRILTGNNTAVNGYGLLDTATVVDGFEVEPRPPTGTSYNTFGMYLTGPATLSHNVVHGGTTGGDSHGMRVGGGVKVVENVVDDGFSPTYSVAIEVGGADSVVKDNVVRAVVGVSAGAGHTFVDSNTITLRGSDGGNGKPRVGVECLGRSDASCTVRYNRVFGDGLSTVESDGLNLRYPGAGRAEGNLVFGGAGSPSVGIRCGWQRGELVNNVVHGGRGPDSIALWLGEYLGDPVVANNTLFAGTGATSRTAVKMTNGVAARLTNNLLFGAASGWVALHQAEPASSSYNSVPATLQSNVFLGVAGASEPAALFRDAKTGVDDTTAAGLEARLCAATHPAAANALLALAPSDVFRSLAGPDGKVDTLDDDDWSLATTDARVTEGGRDTSTFNCAKPATACPGTNGDSCGAVVKDAAGAARSAPFSVGAYEKP